MASKKSLALLKVEVLPSGELALYPSEADGSYQYIYREAAGVYWDPAHQRFHAPLTGYDAKNWSLADWYQHIVATVVSGLGIYLTVTDSTLWQNLSDEGKRQIIHIATT